MSKKTVDLNEAIVWTAAELAKAAVKLEHPERLELELSPEEEYWVRLVRKSYDAGTVKVIYSITRKEGGNISVAFPPANAGFGFSADRSRSNTVEIEFPRVGARSR